MSFVGISRRKFRGRSYTLDLDSSLFGFVFWWLTDCTSKELDSSPAAAATLGAQTLSCLYTLHRDAIVVSWKCTKPLLGKEGGELLQLFNLVEQDGVYCQWAHQTLDKWRHWSLDLLSTWVSLETFQPLLVSSLIWSNCTVSLRVALNPGPVFLIVLSATVLPQWGKSGALLGSFLRLTTPGFAGIYFHPDGLVACPNITWCKLWWF